MQEHPFAPYVRILARGKTNSRPFTMEEADQAMTMILRGETLPEQIGAFLMLLRFKEETAEEVAGFVTAAQRRIEHPTSAPKVDLDWSCYAGKRRQLPWFALAVLALSGTGVKIFIHGSEGHTAGRVYAEETMRALGLPVANSLSAAAEILQTSNLCFVSLRNINPVLAEMIDLKAVLGLRSPIHTLARMLNPFAADHVIQGIFHPGFNAVHQKAAALIGQPHYTVFRGEGGEIERRPQKVLDVLTVHNGTLETEHWPALMADPRQSHDEDMDLSRLVDVWRGEKTDDYGEAAVIGTLAIALKLLGQSETQEAAQAMATDIWQNRNRNLLDQAA